MRIKKMKLCSLLLCIVVLLSACQEAPQEVQERMENYGENEQVTKRELSYCTIDELKAVKPSDINDALDNMVLPEETDFSQIESLAVLDMSYEDKYTENRDKYSKLFHIDKSTIKTNNHGAGKTRAYESDDSSARTYFAIDNSGFISYITGLTYAYINDEVQKVDTIEKYDLAKDDLPLKTVKFDKEEVAITDVVDSAEGWLQKNMPVEQCNYRVSDVYVRDIKLGNSSYKQLSLLAQIIYQGVPMDSYGSNFMIGHGGQAILTNTCVDISYEGKERISDFTNCNGRIKINAIEPLTKIVDLKSAVGLVNDTLSGFNQLKISKLFPAYALFPKYSSENMELAMPGQKVEGRPVYAFLINMDYQGTSEFGIIRAAEHFVYVDMVTGEITTDLEGNDENK